ncbi:MAG: hypothetical protein Q9227_006927 [Pyrenula ochraceoflavens]
MPTPGYVFKDSGTTPPEEKSQEDVELKREKSPSEDPPAKESPKTPQSPRSPLEEKSTDSHALATEDHEIKGAAQRAGKDENVTDLGWRANSKDVETLVGGLPNEELWTLVRRFNKVELSMSRCLWQTTDSIQQMYHVKAIKTAPLGGLDLFVADEDEFSPDKLRSNIERLYMTVGIGVITFGKHIARLRSWREPRRTGGFCAVYFLAWLLDCIVPLLLVTLIILIAIPKSRVILFPPAPLALVNAKTGGAQKPKAGVLGSHDSVTGAPEKHSGEAVEQEASNLVSGIANVAITSAAGAHDQANPDNEENPVDSAIPGNAQDLGTALADHKNAAVGEPVHHDKTKEPMQDALWKQMRPVMRALGDVSDGWERIANALSPTPPFPQWPRLRLASLILPALLLSTYVSPYILTKSLTLILGTAFFSDPALQRGIQLLNEKIPDWPKYLEIRNTLLRGVPTNAQLTITLLRIGEANRAPLPPPPSSSEAPPDQAAEIDKSAITENLDATNSEVEDLITPDNDNNTATTNKDDNNPQTASGETPKKKTAGSRVLSAFKATTATGIATKLESDRVLAAAGSSHAKQHLGVLPKKKASQKAVEGPVEFKCRYQGRKGVVVIDERIGPEGPVIYFSRGGKGNAEWEVPVRRVKEVKKIGGLGWKGKIVVGWAMEREVKEGLEIVVEGDSAKEGGKDGKGNGNGKVYRVMALKERDEVFNRVVSLGGQVWESY